MPPRKRTTSSSSPGRGRGAGGGGASFGGDTRMAVIYGPEPYLRRQRLEELRTALEKQHGEIQTYFFDGKTAPLSDVLDEVRSYSLMQQHKLVVVEDADQFAKNHREALERYAASPVDHATLALRATAWHKGKLDKLIEKAGAIVRCDPLPPGQAQAWLAHRAEQVHRVKLSAALAGRLVERLGSDLGRLDSEVAKLAVLAGEGGAIDAAMIDAAVGRGSDEQAWAVQEAAISAMLRERPGEALEKLHEVIDLSGQARELVTWAMGDLARKLYQAALMAQGGDNAFTICKTLKIWPRERQGPFLDAAKRLGPAGAARLFDRLIRADRRSKSGLGDGLRNLECFCAQLADVNN